MDKINQTTRALVLLSGGQDSTTCLYWSKCRFDIISAIIFDYGQRHHVEIEQAKIIARLAEVPYSVYHIKGAVSGSSITSEPGQSTDDAHRLNPDLPSSWTPARNAVFLSIACGHAYNLQTSNVVTGVCQTDYSGYPDCRNDFIMAMNTAMCLGIGWPELTIHTPLMELTKAETWKLAAELGIVDIIVEHTHTDYHGDRTTRNDWGYGKLDNPASRIRAKGFKEAKEKGWI